MEPNSSSLEEVKITWEDCSGMPTEEVEEDLVVFEECQIQMYNLPVPNLSVLPRSPRPVSVEQQPLSELAQSPNEKTSPTRRYSASPVKLPHRVRGGSFVPLSAHRSLRVIRKPSFRLEDLTSDAPTSGRADMELFEWKETEGQTGEGSEDLGNSGHELFSSRKITTGRATPLLVTRRVIDIREKEARLHKRLPRAASATSGLLLSPRSLLDMTLSP
eukprot:GGOE01007620.1.p1 GENE.GGOE01007620.1~~GGOE01007620.1.p1  ORF type:complete len:217 (-),score=33.89 GGOE01007620.1:1348-1998(-)